MKIPTPINQFEEKSVLFIITGDYEGRFLIAHKGTIKDKLGLKFSMREEGKEKQAYVHSNPGPEKAGAMSHYGKYREDLKLKFYKSIRDKAYDLSFNGKIDEIYLFSPKQTMHRIYGKLKKETRDKIKNKFYGEYTKHSPLEILKIWEKEKKSTPERIYKNKEEEKILTKSPLQRKRIIKK
ncbi:MAG: hypothetical protein UR60_C0006G0013 [Candidatus Moranbacteria bacterium GW2011_GWF2_34_56]|nr:MAG: hypothetical protein UR51_C0005G0018 [Candidatus Moranbacteria bacterium GW2011_GWF1_34_10]KKP65191.1 MAG: hypothetical protein UR60_C0006G0013 [Candidatus Moranbacteria bacterium GW2011_GWF2_34_56]